MPQSALDSAFTMTRILPYGPKHWLRMLSIPRYVFSSYFKVGISTNEQLNAMVLLQYVHFGTEECDLERIPGIHEFRNTQTSRKTTTECEFIPPCVVLVNIRFKILQGYAILLCVPSKRAESCVILVLAVTINALIPRLFLKLEPVWMRHLGILSVLGGENILLPTIQRELEDPFSGNKKLCQFEKRTNRFVVSCHRWMD